MSQAKAKGVFGNEEGKREMSDWQNDQRIIVYVYGILRWEGKFADMPEHIRGYCVRCDWYALANSEEADIIALCTD